MLHLHQTDVAAVLSSNLHVIILQQIHTADLAAMHAETKPVGTADTTIGRHVLQVKIIHRVNKLDHPRGVIYEATCDNFLIIKY